MEIALPDLALLLSYLYCDIDIVLCCTVDIYCRYIGTSISPQYLYILLEYVTGGSIAKILKQFGPIDEELLR